MNKRFVAVASLALAGLFCRPALAADKEKTIAPRPSIQIAILLDTSNSMDGLIAQAKSELWTVVNEFVKAKKDGKPPRLEVALYEYGNNGLSPTEGFVRLVLPLTDDLDKVSEQLFALTTNGGEEYCGKVITDAVAQLKWSSSRDTYKAIFIAGNEPFTQGPVDFHKACRAAIGRGILVNTIFCGPEAEGERTSWKDGAVLADGRYMSIDQNQKVVQIPAPQDAEIARLGVELNKTYIPYGKMGQEACMRQSAQDTNAINTSSNAIVNRSVAKCNAFYCPSDWDLVDAIKTGKLTLDKVKDEDLPENLRKLDQAARLACVTDAAKVRETTQKQILTLSAEREKFLAVERAKVADGEKETLDAALVKAVRSQVSKLNFKFE
jgi:von Willebrand factor type A domain